MSLLNVFIRPNTAVCAVDTDARRNDGMRFPTSKLLVLAHLPAVMASRGQLAVLQFAYVRAVASGLADFDAVVDGMPALLADIRTTMPEALTANLPGTRRGDHLALIGWSERAQAMKGFQWVTDGDDYRQSEFDHVIAPYDAPSMSGIPQHPESLKRLANAQVRWMESTFAGAACGGRLVTATITRYGVSISNRVLLHSLEKAA